MRKLILPAAGMAVLAGMLGTTVYVVCRYRREANQTNTKLVQANEKIAEGVVSGYKKMEQGIVDGYKKMEKGVVGGFTKMTDKFVEGFLTKDGESVEDAKKRLAQEQAARQKENDRIRP